MKMKLKTLIIFAVIISVSIAGVAVWRKASTVGIVTVNILVKDVNDKPVQGAVCTWFNSKGQKINLQYTTADGRAQAMLFPEGTPQPVSGVSTGVKYSLEVYLSDRGYMDLTGPFTALPGEVKLHIFEVPALTDEVIDEVIDEIIDETIDEDEEIADFWSFVSEQAKFVIAVILLDIVAAAIFLVILKWWRTR